MKPDRKPNMDIKGLTIIELIVSLTILLLVLGLGYNFYYFLTQSYIKTEARWIGQREIRKAADFINAELKNTYSLKVTNNNNPTGVEGVYYIYLNNGNIMLKNGTATAVTLAQDNLALQFQKGKSQDNIELDNILAYQVSSSAINYNIDTSVILSNMAEGQSITGTSIGTSIEFKTIADIAAIPSSELSSFCFIATAAYGSNTEPSVMLLRRFKDDVLLQSVPGRKFVNFYYENSPALANKIVGNKVLKYLALGLLTPILGIVVLIMHKEALIILILFALAKLYFKSKMRHGFRR